jgi:hypothetical protein
MEYRLRKNTKNITLVSSNTYQSWFHTKFTPCDKKFIIITQKLINIPSSSELNINIYCISNINFLDSFLPIESNVSNLDLLYIKQQLENIFHGIYYKEDNLHKCIKDMKITQNDKNKINNYTSVKEAYELAYNCYTDLRDVNPHNIDRNVIIDKLHCIPDIQKFLSDYYLLTMILSEENDIIVIHDTSFLLYIKRNLLLHHEYTIV